MPPKRQPPISQASSQDLRHHFAMDVRQTVVAALMPENQAFVLHPETVKDGGIQVVDVNRIARDVVGIVIGFAKADARPDPPPAIQIE